MHGFAEIELLQDITQVPLKFNLLRKTPGFLLDWYIKRFNPFTAEDAEILGEHGYRVKLPLTLRDAQERPGHFQELAARTLATLRDYGVDIIIAPCAPFPKTLPVADGRGVFAFFIRHAAEKMLKQTGKSAKTAEALIIDGDRSLTLCALDTIYRHVNYLTLITESDYTAECAQIYADCGLNVSQTDFNRTSLVDADIIINTREEHKFDYYFKRGAVFFELSRADSAALAAKRDDILIVDGLSLGAGGEELSLAQFECALYLRSRDYRRLKANGDSRMIRPVMERIQTMGYEPVGLTFRGRRLGRGG